MTKDLEGKVVIVTGGAGNIGSAAVKHLAALGMGVVVADRAGPRVGQVVDEIKAAGGRAIGHEGDISAEPDVQDLMRATAEAFGRLDGLVNTVATVRDSDRILDRMEVDGWDHIMAVNVRGPMLACKHGIPLMLKNGGGSIINFTSPAGFYGDVVRIAYSTSKAAIAGFTKSVATVYGKQGIRCNAVAPSTIWTEATRAKLGHDWVDLAERTTLTPRGGNPGDIANTLEFLLSDKSGFITGQVLFVDGGASAHMPWVGVK